MKYLWFFNLMLFFPALCNCDMSLQTDCEMVVEGICIDRNNYDITPRTIDWVIQAVEDEVNIVFPGLDLRGLIDDEGLELEYLTNEEYNERMEDRNLPASWGFYVLGGHKIFSRMFQTSGKGFNCWAERYTLNHELLHYIAQYYLETPELDNMEHAIPYVFMLFYDKSGGNINGP
jgi:hypothetical protein